MIRTNVLIGVMIMIESFIGSTVQIIYIDRKCNISFRTIQIRSVSNGKVKAYCYTAHAPRIFNIEQIIDAELVNRHAG